MTRKSPKFRSKKARDPDEALRRLFKRKDAPRNLLKVEGASQSGLKPEWLYDLGRALDEPMAMAFPGNDGIRNVASWLTGGKPSPTLVNILTEARALVRTFPTKTAFNEFRAELKLSLVRELLKVQNPEDRKSLRDQCLKDRLSLRGLMDAKQSLQEPRSKGGRRARVPVHTALKAALHNLDLLDERWRRSIREWFTGLGTAIEGPSHDDADALEAAIAMVGVHLKSTKQLGKVLSKLARQARRASKRS